MSCPPCLTCVGGLFYQCSACDTSIDASLYLKGSLCITDPVWYIQLGAACMLIVFILFPLFRKRSMVLLRILDMIQMAAFFKYINGYVYYRTNYLYLGMNGALSWTEGFQILSIDGDITPPIFTNDQTFVNKLIRIGSIWVGMFMIILLIGLVKTCCGDAKLELGTFISKNMGNCISLSLYITVQDIAFFIANIFISPSFSSSLHIIFFVVAIILSISLLILIPWQFSIINHCYQADPQEKLYHYEHMVLFRMDYDKFQTFSLLNLPKKQKKTLRYSNMIIILLLYKIGYGVLMASKLYENIAAIEDQIFVILGYILFGQIIWYSALPFDHKRQTLQLIVNILGDIILLSLLVLPLLINSPSFDKIYMILCLSLYVLAIFSGIVEVVLDIYRFIPYDLYQVGLNIVLEDKKLEKQLARRKKQQQQNERRIKQLKQQQQKLLQELKKQKKEEKAKLKTQHGNQNRSQASLAKQQKNLTGENEDKMQNRDKDFLYPVDNDIQERDSEEDVTKYRIDVKKKRRIYEYDKKKPFSYSNKMDE